MIEISGITSINTLDPIYKDCEEPIDILKMWVNNLSPIQVSLLFDHLVGFGTDKSLTIQKNKGNEEEKKEEIQEKSMSESHLTDIDEKDNPLHTQAE